MSSEINVPKSEDNLKNKNDPNIKTTSEFKTSPPKKTAPQDGPNEEDNHKNEANPKLWMFLINEEKHKDED